MSNFQNIEELDTELMNLTQKALKSIKTGEDVEALVQIMTLNLANVIGALAATASKMSQVAEPVIANDILNDVQDYLEVAVNHPYKTDSSSGSTTMN